MKLPRVTNKWIWIALASFLVMLSMTLMEASVYYPQVKSYFDSTKSLSSKNLATRSRLYLLDTIELLNTENYTSQTQEKTQENLNLAYSFLNINLYTQTYPCANKALNNIDTLYEKLSQDTAPNIKEYLPILVSTIYCTENIQAESNRIRSQLAHRMLDNITTQLQIMMFGTCVFFALCLIFWSIHKKQRQLISKNKNEKDKWLKNAMEDALTGAKNRRALDSALIQYTKGNKPYSMLMCDIDHFKKYNDQYGHLEGDKVLRNVADTIKDILRHQDTLYRYGGEELVIILDKTDKKSAIYIAQRIKTAIQDLALSHPDSNHNIVTISIGCASSSEITNDTKNLVKLADERLYVAKKEGRNCIAY